MMGGRWITNLIYYNLKFYISNDIKLGLVYHFLLSLELLSEIAYLSPVKMRLILPNELGGFFNSP